MPLAEPPQPVRPSEATGSIQRLEPTPTAPSPAAAPEGLDYRKIADHVYQDIRHRLQIERERQRGSS
jgi:hypothetical protein